MNVIPTSCWIRFSSTCICLRSFRSRAPSGSSRRRTAGRLISARARATRWAWPPEIWSACGLEAGQLDELQHLGDPTLDLGALHALAAEPERDVLEDRQVGEQGVVLEDRVDVALERRQPRHVLALELDQSRRRLLEAADHPEGRRLAAARRPEEAEELAVAHLEVDVVDGDLVPELLDDIDEADVDLRHLALSLRARDRFWPADDGRLGDRGMPSRRTSSERDRQAENRCRRRGCQEREVPGTLRPPRVDLIRD